MNRRRYAFGYGHFHGSQCQRESAARLPETSLLMTTPWNTRVEEPADLSQVRAVTLAAFDTDQEAAILDALRDDPAWIEGLSFVATDDDGNVVGHAVLSRCTIDQSSAVIAGPVSVLPEYQKQGVGTAVMWALLHAAKAMGENHVLLVGHPQYYPRFGFTRASTHGIRLSIEVPDEAVMALTLDQDAPLPSGTVTFADAFGL